MNKLKRIITALLAAAVLFTGAVAFAEDTNINISAAEPNEDGTITVTISLQGGENVAGAQFALEYDDSVLELVKTKNGAMTSGGLTATNDQNSGSVIFVWAAIMGSKEPGELLKLTFRPKDGASGSTEIKLDKEASEIIIVNEDLNELTFSESSAEISLGASAGADTQGETAAPVSTPEPGASDADISIQVGQSTSVAGETETGIVWSSGNDRIATVDENGNITALAEGETVIYGVSEDGSSVTETTIYVAAGETADTADTAGTTETETIVGNVDESTVTIAETQEKSGVPSWVYVIIALAAAAGIAALCLALKAKGKSRFYKI